MSVRAAADAIYLEGACYVEDAEVLLVALAAAPELPVDLSACRHMHGAVMQILLATGAAVVGDSPEPFIRSWAAPALTAARAELARAGQVDQFCGEGVASYGEQTS